MVISDKISQSEKPVEFPGGFGYEKTLIYSINNGGILLKSGGISGVFRYVKTI